MAAWVSDIEHHHTVRSLPAACHGLTRAQVNAATDTALAVTAGRRHRVNRERLAEIRPLLGYTLARFAAQPNLPPVTLPESPRPAARRWRWWPWSPGWPRLASGA